MTAHGVAGPREVPEGAGRLITRPLEALGPGDELVSGAAHGVDTIAVLFVYGRYGADVRIRLTVPAAPHNEALVARLRPVSFVTVEEAPAGKNYAHSYLIRDKLTVARSRILLAYPKTAREEQRSGTWATVRYARQAGIEVVFHPLDGGVRSVEPARLSLFS